MMEQSQVQIRIKGRGNYRHGRFRANGDNVVAKPLMSLFIRGNYCRFF